MHFQDGSLFPENMPKLVITAAPYGPEWMPSDFPEDIPVTLDQQVQKAVDCYNAGATVAHFVRACPDGAVLTLESSMLNTLPVNLMAIANGLHVRCGIEDNLWSQRRDRKVTTVEQIEQLVRVSREFGRDIAGAQEARTIYRIGTFYRDAGETLAMNGFAPNLKTGPSA